MSSALQDSTFHIRILPELRSAQIERGFVTTPCRILYFARNFDLGSAEVPSNYEKVNLVSACKALFMSRSTVLETAEPLWVRFLPKNVALIAAWRLGGFIRKTRRFTVCFAIENNSIDEVIFGNARTCSAIRKFARCAVSHWVGVSLDRIAFGTEGAAGTYSSLNLDARVSTRVWADLPARQKLTRADPVGVKAIFVGRLEARKGLHELMAQWPQVENRLPSAQLTVVGSGKLYDEVRRWCEARPSSRTLLGQLEHSQISEVIARHSVLVAPSVRAGRWREQIGLPIVEALSLGLTVVTTDETGLAPWLEANGHTVVAASLLSGSLAYKLSAALTSPLDKNDVLNSLPLVPVRIRSDEWMHSIAEDAQGEPITR